MRLFLLTLFCVLGTAPAMAQTAVSREAANAYYQNCMAKDDPRMTDLAQEGLCSCTAARMMTALTMEDIAAMTPEPGLGRIPFNKMLTEVYGPCMQYPVEDQLNKECMNDTKVNQFALRDQGALCRCMAGRSGQLLSTEGAVIMRDVLARNPNLADPMDAILSNASFRQRAYENLYSCLHAGN